MSNKNTFNFYEDISLNIERIANSASQLAEKSLIDGPIFNSIISAIVAAFAAYIFTHLHWVKTRKKENICSAARSMNELIIQLEDISILYWLSNINGKDDNIYATEIKIKSLLRMQIGLFKQLEKLINKSENLNNLKISIDEDFDLISGGDFESKSKPSNPVVATKIGAICSRIKIQLSAIVLEI